MTKKVASKMYNLQPAIEGGFATIPLLNEGVFKTVNQKVNRAQSVLDSLKATGRIRYVDDELAQTAPCGTEGEVELVFFKLDKSLYKSGLISSAVLEGEYEKRGFIPDLQALADFNTSNPTYADKNPHGCQWRDKDGESCCATFGLSFDERSVFVHRGRGWAGDWPFAGVRKGPLIFST